MGLGFCVWSFGGVACAKYKALRIQFFDILVIGPMIVEQARSKPFRPPAMGMCIKASIRVIGVYRAYKTRSLTNNPLSRGLTLLCALASRLTLRSTLCLPLLRNN